MKRGSDRWWRRAFQGRGSKRRDKERRRRHHQNRARTHKRREVQARMMEALLKLKLTPRAEVTEQQMAEVLQALAAAGRDAAGRRLTAPGVK